MSGIRQLVIFPSELGTCIGESKFKTTTEMMIEIWRRTDQHGYRKAEARRRVPMVHPSDATHAIRSVYSQDTIKATDAAVNDEELATELVEAAKNQCLMVANDLQTNPNISPEMIQAAQALGILSSEDVKELHADKESQTQVITRTVQKAQALGTQITKEDAIQCLNTTRGNIHEKLALDSCEREMGMAIVERNAKSYKLDIQFDEPGWRLILSGRIDGITEDGKTIIEVKNRQGAGLAHRAWPTERIQLYAYMAMTGIHDGHVQEYCHKTKESYTIAIPYNDEEWKQIESRLREFAKSMVLLLTDEKTQDKLLDESQKLNARKRTSIQAQFSFASGSKRARISNKNE